MQARKFALILMSCVMLCACTTDVQSGIQTANDLLYRQKYVDAERLYRKMLKRIESDHELSETAEAQRLLVLDRLGEINAFYLHDYTQAVTDFENLARKYPKDDHALTAISTMADLYHYKINNLQLAIAAYQRVVTTFPTRTEARDAQLEIVAAYFKLKNYDQARTEAATLISRWPGTLESGQAQFETADSYYLQKRYTEAIASYQTLLAGNADKSEQALVLFELGNCYQELGEADRALNYYYEALPAHPNPALVQRKIQRVRTRVYHLAPSVSILNGPHTPIGRPMAASTPSRRARAAEAAAPTTAEDNAGSASEDEVIKEAPAPSEAGHKGDTSGE